MSKDKILNAAQAARILHISPQYMRRLCVNGKVKAEKLGATWVIRESVLKDVKLKQQEA